MIMLNIPLTVLTVLMIFLMLQVTKRISAEEFQILYSPAEEHLVP